MGIRDNTAGVQKADNVWDRPDGLPEYITDEFWEDTVRLWSRLYYNQGIVLTIEDAVDIVQRYDRMLGVLGVSDL